MDNKYNESYEHKIVLLAQNRVEKGNFKVFDNDARVITKKDFPQLVETGKSDSASCLVICNRDGETVVITQEFSKILFNALKSENP